MGNQDEFLEVLDPTAPAEVTEVKANSKIDTPAGKRVGLFWNRKPNGDILLSRFGQLLQDRYPDIKIVRLEGKNDPAQGAPEEVLNEAAQKCDAVILASGD
jgi:hypothetical protein